jgi:prepilin-type processing-associated H-X9-DG protein
MPPPMPPVQPVYPPTRKRSPVVAIVVIGGVVALLVIGLLVSILLPSLNRARDAANRIKCAANMRMIAQAIFMYQNNDPQQAFPPDLVTLAAAGQLQPDQFICPSSSDNDATGSNWQQAIVPGSGCCSYVAVLNAKVASARDPANTVMLYEPSGNHDDRGGNFLFADGSVEWMSAPDAQAVITSITAGKNPPPMLVK